MINGAPAVNVGDAVATIQEFTGKTISLASGTSKDISGSRSILREVWINTAPAAAVTVSNGGSLSFTIPAGTTPGPLFFGDVGMSKIVATYTAGVGNMTFV